MLLGSSLFSQIKWVKKHFNETSYSIQYAGSTGFISLGIQKVTTNKKFEIGIQTGKIPSFIGQVQRTAVGKFLYAPFQLNHKSFIFQPLTSGLFFARYFGENHGNWSNKYPKGYYWWNRSMRSHVFIGSQISLTTKSNYISRMAIYFEANTNDLYLYSYIPNRKSMSLYDIIFFGTGIKLYMK